MALDLDVHRSRAAAARVRLKVVANSVVRLRISIRCAATLPGLGK
jgi:hypothetical protein